MEVSGTQMIVGLVIGIAFLIFLVLRTKIHALIALLLAASVTGIVGGMRPNDVIETITEGFGSTLGSIGIIIGLGVMMGRILEVSGAAERLAYSLIEKIRKKKEEWALAISGYIVAIPIFVDSAFVILQPLVKELSSRTRKSVVALGVALAVGLAATHHSVPPTPGPLGVAGIFGADVGMMILTGLLFSIPIIAVGVFYARWIGKRIYQLPDEDGESFVRPDKSEIYKEFLNEVEERGKELPSFTKSIMPILIPIVLIFLNTTLNALHDSGAFVMNETFLSYVQFIGDPVIAVGIGLVVAIYTLTNHLRKPDALNRMEEGLTSAGIILLVTGAGGALGEVLRASGTGDLIANKVATWSIPAILVPFFISTFVRLVQGSGTVAMITAASISAPIVTNLDVNLVLAAQAAALGALVFSYFNDSLFWIVNRMLGIKDVKEQMLVWSVPTTLGWGVALISLVLVNFVIQLF
ncbi:MAG TPA: gluconate:H+ symporter [Pseudogracilibacillus sp.]|nr:gluconate:H+ symporter [Pseudogracilibacillus sp.]